MDNSILAFLTPHNTRGGLMRGLYALGVYQRPQISTDHVRHISLDPFRSNTPNRESNDGKPRYDRAAGLIVAKVRPANTPMKVLRL
jgi:hypothetical protein